MPPEAGGILFVHAHPDDESVGTGGTIARCIAEGRRVDLVTCTDGAQGEVHDSDLDPEEAQPRLAQIRADELACSVAALGGGALRLHKLGYRDSGMMGTEGNDDPLCFWHCDIEEAVGRLVAIVRQARPAVIASYDENGNYGHPDHINAARIAREAYEAAADPHRYPDAGPAHEVDRYYEIAFNRDGWFRLLTEMRERGIKLPWYFDEALEVEDAPATPAADELNPSNAEALRQVGEQLEEGKEPPEGFGTPEEQITTFIDVGPYTDAKRRSMACHRTQSQDMGWMLDLPDDLAQRVLSPEYFVLRRWRGRDIPADLREEGLFPAP